MRECRELQIAGTSEVGKGEKSPAATVWHWKSKRVKQVVQLSSDLLYKTRSNLRAFFFFPRYLRNFVTTQKQKNTELQVTEGPLPMPSISLAYMLPDEIAVSSHRKVL